MHLIQAQELTDKDTAEYTSGMGGYEEGGRVGYRVGGVSGREYASNTAASKSVATSSSRNDGGGGGGDDDGPKGPPSVINPPPKTNPILDRTKKMNRLGDSPFKKFAAHDKFTDMMKMMKVPNYHQMGGFDFMARFPNINPDVAKGLGTIYQQITEMAKGNPDPLDDYTDIMENAQKKAIEEARLNAVGIDDFFDPTSETYKQYTNPATLLPVAQLANGGRINYARGDTAEQNAIQASGIMDLPLNQNPAGITELDLRESGGFIPPVGVKEKADDIPAMLSNNEFVFTADAVRGMGDGNVNLGAQRMYDMMKKLENGGRV